MWVMINSIKQMSTTDARRLLGSNPCFQTWSSITTHTQFAPIQEGATFRNQTPVSDLEETSDPTFGHREGMRK